MVQAKEVRRSMTVQLAFNTNEAGDMKTALAAMLNRHHASRNKSENVTINSCITSMG
jgi:hypothetical protein